MNEQQNLNIKQKLHVKEKPKLFTANELMTCRSIGDAYFYTWKLSGKPRKVIEIDADIDASTLSRIFSGTKNIPEDKERKFYEVCGNYFAYQWKGFQMGLSVDYRKMTLEEENQYLRNELMRAQG